ncbi:acyltransferase [Apibacter sp. HY039]|uniref:acyltransferase n=1 Tax=Apibacter sp. HY039 TaxID=2501476 RepID=UPI000FEBA478|nr:acyltransferase family protein [Apibacter sp. HY039]
MEKNKDNKIPLIWIENLRAIAAMAVVLLHVSAQMIYSFGNVPDSQWWAANLYESFTRFCVPVFLMITGALTLGKPYKLTDFLKKRFTRILIPFLFWSLIYIMYNLSREFFKFHRTFDLEFVKYSLEYGWNKLAFGAGYHMWYIYLLISLYLIHPVINRWLLNSNRKEQIYFLCICAFAVLINYFPFVYLKTSVDLSFFSQFLGFFVLGYFLFTTKLNINNRNKIILFFVYFFSCLLISLDTYLSSVKNGVLTENYKPWDIIQAISIFIIFKTVSFFNKKNRFLSFISKYSYGIYLIHVLMIDISAKIGLAHYTFNPYLSIPATFLFTLFLSVLILWIIDRLPLGKYVVK